MTAPEIALKIDGVEFGVPSAAILRAIVDEAAAHPERLKILNGCERCAAVCVLGVVDCYCCAIYGTKTGGGTIYYPEDERGHRPLMPIAEFTERANAWLLRHAA